VRRTIAILAAAAVALVIPAALVVNGLRLLANDWYVHAEYARPGFPDDPYGLAKDERTDLALIGLRSIQPHHSEGVQLLREARLPDGSPAFTEREIVHMQDVRTLVGALYWYHLGALALILVVALAFRRSTSARGLLSRALLAGGVLTLAGALLLVVLMLTAFDWLFTNFHLAFFEGESWRFPTSDTLIRIYPETFWSDFSIVLGALTVLQAVTLAASSWWWLRRGRRTAPAGALAESHLPSAP
jgi:integral membrane protein (TIGR01906 family)